MVADQIMVMNENGVREALGKLGSEEEEKALEIVINAWRAGKEKVLTLKKKTEEMGGILKEKEIALETYAKRVEKLKLESKAFEDNLAREKGKNVDLHAELAKQQESYDEILGANKILIKEKIEVVQERDGLKNTRDVLMMERNNLTAANNALVQKSKDLLKEKEKAMKQKKEAQKDRKKERKALVASEDKLRAYKKVMNIAEVASQHVEGGLENFVTGVKKVNLILKDARTLVAGHNPGKKTKSARKKERKLQESLSKKEASIEKKFAGTKRTATRLGRQKVKKMRMDRGEEEVNDYMEEEVAGELVGEGGVELEEAVLRDEVQ